MQWLVLVCDGLRSACPCTVAAGAAAIQMCGCACAHVRQHQPNCVRVASAPQRQCRRRHRTCPTWPWPWRRPATQSYLEPSTPVCDTWCGQQQACWIHNLGTHPSIQPASQPACRWLCIECTLTSTLSRSTPCAANVPHAPSSSNLVTRSLNRATTTAKRAPGLATTPPCRTLAVAVATMPCLGRL